MFSTEANSQLPTYSPEYKCVQTPNVSIPVGSYRKYVLLLYLNIK